MGIDYYYPKLTIKIVVAITTTNDNDDNDNNDTTTTTTTTSTTTTTTTNIIIIAPGRSLRLLRGCGVGPRRGGRVRGPADSNGSIMLNDYSVVYDVIYSSCNYVYIITL